MRVLVPLGKSKMYTAIAVKVHDVEPTFDVNSAFMDCDFSNMEGWIDIFSCEDELSKIPYADNPKKVLRYHVGSGPDLTEADEEVEE